MSLNPDLGPADPELTEYVDAEILEKHCEACRIKRIAIRQARKHKPQTFKRGA